MNAGDTLELLARGAAVGAFVGLAIIVVRGALSPARIAGALFSIAAAAHTLTQMTGVAIDQSLGALWPLVWSLSVGAGLFWVFVGELFEDRPGLQPWRFAPAAILLAIGAGGANAEPSTARVFWLAHILASTALIVHALVAIATGWRGDLVETRRRLRGPILAIGAGYALIVLLVQTGEFFIGSAEAASPLGALALMVLAFLSRAAFGRADASLFGAPRRPDANAESSQEPASAHTAGFVRSVLQGVGPDAPRLSSASASAARSASEIRGCCAGLSHTNANHSAAAIKPNAPNK